jgi:hypothetical protein
MKASTILASLLILLTCAPFSPTLLAQGGSAVPYLIFSASPQGNGMGGVLATLPSSDATATMANPGQLGLFGLDNLLSVSTYAPKTELYPGMPFPGFHPTITVTALSAGVNLQGLLSLPIPVSVGAGYARTFLDLGKFSITGSEGPEVIGVLDMNDTYENYSVGVGLEYFARLGIGMNFKKITSKVPGISERSLPVTNTATPSATDFGILLDVPVGEMLTHALGNASLPGNLIDPVLNISLGYVRSNVGDEVRYMDFVQADPLPRTAVLGLGFEAGLSAKAGNRDWKMVSCSLARQAQDLLVVRHADGTFEYEEGLGEIRFGENLLVGRVTGNVAVRKGWQIGVAELLYLRGGSVWGELGSDYTTSGYSLCFAGLIRLLEFASADLAATPWIEFLGDHFDVQYHSATYATPGLWSDGATYNGVNLVIQGSLW